jgi:prepilin-type N-terminal cleavage/methylation domain-containing protein
MTRAKGFTLVELLVVVAIIALLVACLLPCRCGILAQSQLLQGPHAACAARESHACTLCWYDPAHLSSGIMLLPSVFASQTDLRVAAPASAPNGQEGVTGSSKTGIFGLGSVRETGPLGPRCPETRRIGDWPMVPASFCPAWTRFSDRRYVAVNERPRRAAFSETPRISDRGRARAKANAKKRKSRPGAGRQEDLFSRDLVTLRETLDSLGRMLADAKKEGIGHASMDHGLRFRIKELEQTLLHLSRAQDMLPDELRAREADDELLSQSLTKKIETLLNELETSPNADPKAAAELKAAQMCFFRAAAGSADWIS